MSIQCRSKQKGFTLVELVVTISVVIILSAISVPLYMTNVEKAKMAEGYALLGTILSAQKQYHAEYGNFLGSNSKSAVGSATFSCNDEVLHIDTRQNKYFTWMNVSGDYDHYGEHRGPRLKYEFNARVQIPSGLSSQGFQFLCMDYSMTAGGATYYTH